MKESEELKNFWKDEEKVKKAEEEILREEKEKELKKTFTKSWKEKNNSIKVIESNNQEKEEPKEEIKIIEFNNQEKEKSNYKSIEFNQEEKEKRRNFIGIIILIILFIIGLIKKNSG